MICVIDKHSALPAQTVLYYRTTGQTVSYNTGSLSLTITAPAYDGVTSADYLFTFRRLTERFSILF